MIMDAIISQCGSYRFRLMREFTDLLTSPCESCLFVLNNPSTADANVNDPTATRGIGFTKSWEFGRMWFGNTNPHRSTNPYDAIIPPEEILSENDKHLRAMAEEASLIIAAWGNLAPRRLSERALSVLLSVRDVHVLGLTKDGNPKHILYLRSDLKPALWQRCRN